MGSILGLVLFNVFINDLEGRVAYILSKFSDCTKLGRVTDTLEVGLGFRMMLAMYRCSVSTGRIPIILIEAKTVQIFNSFSLPKKWWFWEKNKLTPSR